MYHRLQNQYHRAHRGIRACALVLLMAGCAVASADPLVYSVNVDGASKKASVDAFQEDGQAYVSIRKLAEQCGGVAREQPGKITLDLGGRSAVIALGGTQVNTSTAEFTLHHRVIGADGGPYVAVEDLTRLFDQAFGATIAPATPDNPAPADKPAPDTEENMNLLEEVSTTPAPDPAATPETPATPTALPGPTADGKYLVFLDPGHGGNDPGIVSGGGASEKDITLAIAQGVAKAFADDPAIKIALSRTDDRDLSIPERSNAANQAKAALFIGIHAGGSTSPAAHGFEVFIQGAASGPRAMGAIINGESRYQAEQVDKLLAARTGAESRGIHEAPLRSLAKLNMPAMLIETGMLTTPAEESLLASAAYQEKIAGALVDLIKQAATRTPGAK